MQQSVAPRPRAVRVSEPVPNLGLGEHVRRTASLDAPAVAIPAVAHGVPHRERAGGVRIQQETGTPRPFPARWDPPFGPRHEDPAILRLAQGRSVVDADPNRRRLLHVTGTSLQAERHPSIDLRRPASGHRPPCAVQEEALPETVVAGDQIHARRELCVHPGRGTYVEEYEILEHDHRGESWNAPAAPSRYATPRSYFGEREEDSRGSPGMRLLRGFCSAGG